MVTTDKVMPQITVRSHPFRPLPLSSSDSFSQDVDVPDIRVVGVGTFGISAMQLLAKNLSGVHCHDLLRGTGGECSSDFSSFLSTTRTSDIIFILTGFDDEVGDAAAQMLGSAAVEGNVLTIVVTCAESVPRRSSNGTKWYDAIFSVGDYSLLDNSGLLMLSAENRTRHAMRQVIATITSLITHRTWIGIDFADVKCIMRDGDTGRLGVGMGSGATRAEDAAIRAVDGLTAQGIDVSTATGVLAAVHGSGEITMEDFDAASKVIHDRISADANLLVGLISDEGLDGNVKVTVMTAHHSWH